MNYRLAMVYSPYQEWQNIYNGEKALENGTLFAELNKPFAGYKCNKGVCQL
ncbi:MAG: spore coat associated protein CotJA [Clostridia bacterium]|nr:spore coat associated protein CotJA [Clostridia bacterium]